MSAFLKKNKHYTNVRSRLSSLKSLHKKYDENEEMKHI